MRTVDVMTGALVCIWAWAIRRVGGFDESYPLYVEDVDLCDRVRTLGPLVQFPGVVGVHVGGVCAASAPVATAVLLHASRVRYWRARSRLAGAAARLTVVAGCGLRRLRHPSRRGTPLRALIRASTPDFALASLLPPYQG
ncbi:MAG: hypothetical protein ACRD12_15710 [Acidimicrobiales bacterium]